MTDKSGDKVIFDLNRKRIAVLLVGMAGLGSYLWFGSKIKDNKVICDAAVLGGAAVITSWADKLQSKIRDAKELAAKKPTLIP